MRTGLSQTCRESSAFLTKILPGLFLLVFLVLTECPLNASVKPGDLTDLSLEDLMNITVYGASRFEQRLTDAPSSITIVTADEIKKYGYRTVADVLKSLRGFHVSYDRNYSYLGMRGFGRTGDYNSRFLLLVDGHRINENIYDSIFVGTDFILDVDLIDRIEVIRGPSSSLYGSNAFFGVINVITRKGNAVGGAEVSGEAGSFDTYKGRLTYGRKFDSGFDAVLSGSLYDSNGKGRLFFKEFDDPSTNNGIADKGDYDRNYSLFSKMSFHDFALEGAFSSRTKGIPTASFGTDFNDRRNQTVDELGYVYLKYEREFRDLFTLMARLFYNSYEYKGTYVYSDVLNKDTARGQWWGGELLLGKTLFQKHKVSIGAEYQVNAKQQQRNYDEDPFAEFLNDKRHSKKWAVYVQDEFTLTKGIIFNAGVRYDRYYSFGSTVNPRLALICEPFEKAVFKLLYGTAFRAPNAYETYYAAEAGALKSNPGLKPEKIRTYEVVYEHYLGDRLRLTGTAFNYRISDLIRQVEDPADGFLVFQNIEKIRAKGLELELEAKWGNGLQGRISYTFQEARDGETGSVPVNSPQHLAKLNLISPLFHGKLFAGVELQYVSKRKTLENNTSDDFFTANITLSSQKLVRGLELSASVYNLFDKRYGDPGSSEHRMDIIEQDGRVFRVKLTYKY